MPHLFMNPPTSELGSPSLITTTSVHDERHAQALEADKRCNDALALIQTSGDLYIHGLF